MTYQVSLEKLFPSSPLPNAGKIMHVVERQFVVVTVSLQLLKPFTQTIIVMDTK
jgi:hypothetical protein